MFTILLTVAWPIAVCILETGCRRLVEHPDYLKASATKRLNSQKPLVAIAVCGNAYQHLQRFRGVYLQAATLEQVFKQARQKTGQPIQQSPFDRTDRKNRLRIPVAQKPLDRPA